MMNESQFQELYETTRLPLRAFVLRSMGDADLADDIVQEAFVRMLGARIVDSDPESLRRYVFRVASNLMRDHWRRQAHRTTVSHDDIVDMQAQSHDPVAGHDVADALARLTPTQRSVMWLAYVEEYPHRDIADLLRLKEKSIRVLLHRARTKFLDTLNELGLGNDE